MKAHGMLMRFMTLLATLGLVGLVQAGEAGQLPVSDFKISVPELPGDPGHSFPPDLIERLSERAKNRAGDSATENTEGSILFDLPIRHGITKALVVYDQTLKPSLRQAGYITRDDRQVERKKIGPVGV